jgi:light-regulated signal transduction histidine kinase (bacteriophytochrome)
MGIVSAEGVAVVSAGEVISRGRTPSPALIQEIAAWVEEKQGFRPFATASLGIEFAPARAASDVASGLLTFALPGATERRLLWFRPELIQTVSWGGDPAKPVAAPPGDRLRPRHSFALWRDEVRLRSSPWTAGHLEAADELQRRAIEVDLERRFSSEQRAVRARDELLAVVSHDLQNPLASIVLDAKSMLRLTPGDDDKVPVRILRQCAEGIEESASRMISLTNELLDLASIEEHGIQLHLQLVESRKLVEDALRSVSTLAEAKGITLAMGLTDSPRLEADPERILRVLSNLLGNAIKFTPDSGTITVRAERRGDDFSIAVADTGPGIAADHLPHVFDRYWKGRAMAAPGSGLGLYIARGIIEAHGGKIWAESSAAGARFTFTLPLAR